MRVTLAERGGLAAAIGPRRSTRALDADALDVEDQRTLRELIEAAAAEPSTRSAGGSAGERAGRDVMSYTVTVDDAGPVRRLSASDTSMSAAFAALVAWLQEHTG